MFVEVLDVNDNRPIFLQNSYEASVLENVANGTSVLQVLTHGAHAYTHAHKHRHVHTVHAHAHTHRI